MSPLEAFLRKHGHYPTARLGRLTVWVAPGYVAIEERGHIIYIPRKTLVPLLKWLLPKAKHMSSSFDPRQAMSNYLDAEEQHLRGLRRLKKTLYRR